MSFASVHRIFEYLGIERTNYYDHLTDVELMEELDDVIRIAEENNMDFCFIDDAFRFEMNNTIKTENFILFN